ncbi:Crp/Fnr family transcriptional regulator [Methylobacterium sp. WL103]|uniref:Crp/Fnr family transcriptional regulator n=1 Tax=unclassified Methylobacterium TaxID=2615210 RepID=UPI0011C70C89|nr:MULTISPECIES: Crp/Fnr family transcriptional regulator [unclassified Methylobacterium]TXM76710.1 Crp/Fnr family transcriptional regulator [Methylobacterium sp. WL12]TXM97455.1 Crp/Fnr family transcriptional regulator [Methylobacterium sp. WL103]
MGIEDDIAILAAAPVFEAFGRDALRLLTFAAERRSLEPGETLFSRGDPADGGFVVLSGTIALAPRVAGGDTVLAGRSALIGRLALFVRGERPGDAAAQGAAEVMRITPTLMRRVLEEFPDAAAVIHDALADDLSALNQGFARVRAMLDAD